MKPRTEYDIDAVALTPEAMDEAKRAAAAAGISIQAWVTRTIIASAQTAPVPSDMTAPIPRQERTVSGASVVRDALGRLKNKNIAQDGEGTPSDAPDTAREPP